MQMEGLWIKLQDRQLPLQPLSQERFPFWDYSPRPRALIFLE